jgi:hypothetical protein
MSAVLRMPNYTAQTELFERTEAELYAWGRERRRLTKALGAPTISVIATMIDEQKVFEQQRRGTRKRKRASVVRRIEGAKVRKCASCTLMFSGAECPRCSPQDIAVAMGHAERAPTIRGASTFSSKTPVQTFTATAAQVQAAVDRLHGWMARAIYRYYAYGQYDRNAANDLHMPRERFTAERVAAVAMVATILAQMRECAVRFATPSRAVGEPAR